MAVQKKITKNSEQAAAIREMCRIIDKEIILFSKTIRRPFGDIIQNLFKNIPLREVAVGHIFENWRCYTRGSSADLIRINSTELSKWIALDIKKEFSIITGNFEVEADEFIKRLKYRLGPNKFTYIFPRIIKELQNVRF